MSSVTKRDQVFISYSHKDKKLFDQLQTFLKPLVRDKKFSVWDDTKIKSGDTWREEIKTAISSARVAVLLVSQDFLASDFIAEHELPPVLEAAQKEGLRILWVAARHSVYEETEIARYQAVNDPARPLATISGASREKELVRICKEIKAAASQGTNVEAHAQTGTVYWDWEDELRQLGQQQDKMELASVQKRILRLKERLLDLHEYDAAPDEIRDVEERIRRISATLTPAVADRELLGKLKEALPSNGSIRFIRDFIMGSAAFDRKHLDDLYNFFRDWNDVEHEFLDKELEEQRSRLFTLIDEYLALIALNTFPTADGARLSIPSEWRYEQNERYVRVVNELHGKAEEVFIAHQDLMRTARYKLEN